MAASEVYLESDRLALREFRRGDWSDACKWLCDAEVMKFFGSPMAEGVVRAFTGSLADALKSEDRKAYQLALVLAADNSVVGDFSFFLDQYQYHPRHAQIGYRLARRCWGRGYGSEGVGLLLRLGFENMRLHKISAGVSSSNTASIRVLEKNGMRREGLLREHQFISGEWHDEIVFGILAPEWASGHRE